MEDLLTRGWEMLLGLRGRVEEGRSGGGNSYGYNVVLAGKPTVLRTQEPGTSMSQRRRSSAVFTGCTRTVSHRG
jgi:hypothetical protein